MSKLHTIIIVNDTPNMEGGASKVAITEAVSLSKMGYQIYFFSAMPLKNRNTGDSDITYINLDQYDILNDPSRARAITQGIWNCKAKKEFECLLFSLSKENTILHFHSWTKSLSSSLFKVAKKYNFKTVVTLHDYFAFCPNGGFFNYKQKTICSLNPLSVKCLFSNCDSRSYFHKLWRCIRQMVQNRQLYSNKIHFITISQLNNKIAKKYLSNSLVYHLDNPIELGESQLIYEKVPFKYVFIGRISPEKGVDLFCQSLSQLNLQGMIIGDGDQIDRYIELYPNIEFVGWKNKSEIDVLIRNSKALIFPSLLYEGSPLTTKEVAAMGIPAIVPDINAANEDVIDGVTGFYFKSGDIESLKRSILKMEHSDWFVLRDNTLKYFSRERYKLENHIKNLLQIYEQIMS